MERQAWKLEPWEQSINGERWALQPASVGKETTGNLEISWWVGHGGSTSPTSQETALSW